MLVGVALWAPIGVGAAWTVVRLLGLERGFPLVPLIAYTPYVALATVLVVAVALVARRWLAAAAATAVMIALASAVVPRAFPDAAESAAAGSRLTLMTANMNLGRADLGPVVELVRGEGVDILGVQELTPDAVGGLRRLGLERLLPEHELIPLDGSAGGGLYSRLPLLPLPQIGPGPGGFAMPRALIRLPRGPTLEALSAHPRPPTRSDVDAWADELRSLPEADPDGRIRLLLGDFNATLDHEELRRLIDGGYTDAAAAGGAGLATTWPDEGIVPPPVTIDHLLVDSRIEVLDAAVHDLPDSDHRAVLADVLVPSIP